MDCHRVHAEGQDHGAVLVLMPNEQPKGGAAAALQGLVGAALGALLLAHGSGVDGGALAEQLSQARQRRAYAHVWQWTALGFLHPMC
jgi:hypothetical protein